MRILMRMEICDSQRRRQPLRRHQFLIGFLDNKVHF